MSFLREDKEFQMELLELNREHYRAMMEYYTLLTIGLALLFAVLCTLVPVALVSGEVLYMVIATIVTAIVGPTLIVLWVTYMRRTACLEEQMRKLREKYLW